MNAQIVKGLGGDVVFDPPQAGRPTVANVTLYKSSGTELEASAAAAQDQVNTTLGADAAAKATAVTVASTTGIAVRRVYLLANTLGQHEFVRVKAVDTATKIVTLARGLVNGYLTSDGFVSPRLSVAVSVADSATLEEGLYAEFVYTVAGVSHTVRRFFDIVLV
ncbi:MAG: hypothetical protein CMK74_12385, partial [Pseudomonadales bacterium]|nr:hypothetical protein [Pseudomonadales bacterium]